MAFYSVTDTVPVQYQIIRYADDVVIDQGTAPFNAVCAWNANWDDRTTYCRVVKFLPLSTDMYH